MNYGIWSKQCDSCYGAHKDIIVSVAKPADPTGCPFCAGMMYAYELGKGFRTRPNELKYDYLPFKIMAAA